ncbi:MAG: FHA domain-containing protein [Sarcina sp.]
MDLNKLMGFAFNILFVVILLLIILYSLKIMSKDIVGRGKGKQNKKQQSDDRPSANSKSERRPKKVETIKQEVDNNQNNNVNVAYALEVVSTVGESSLNIGARIPMKNITTLGRKDGNTIVLKDKFVSSKHASIYVKNGMIVVEDLNSTNGTFVNDERITGKIRVGINDTVRVGSTIFKIIG